MKILNCNKIQFLILRAFYRLAPFSIKGQLQARQLTCKSGFLSCLIISNKIKLLKELLEDLERQSISKDKFEIVIIFDRPGEDFVQLLDNYKSSLNIQAHQSSLPIKVLSNLRNRSIAMSCGEYLLFLDDDTRIFQNNFIEVALAMMLKEKADVIIPQSNSLYGIVRYHYDYQDRFSFVNRCSLYRRSIIEFLGGFLDGMNTYEDTELSIRLMIHPCKIIQSDELQYYHPPHYFDSMRKPLSLGQAVFQIRQHYSLFVWILVYLNALRFLAYALIPVPRFRQWFKISLGVLLFPFTGKSYYY